MEIEKIWEGIQTKDCDNVLKYDDLCSNVSYLKMYGKANYEQNKETFEKLKKIMNNEKPAIFSFGCGIGLDSVGAKEIFGNHVVYFPIDEYKWAICETKQYKDFEPKLPRKFIKYDESIWLLQMTQNVPVICFFHSLYSIKKEKDVKKDLLKVLKGKNKFYFVCNFTINNHYGPTLNERDYIDSLIEELSQTFTIKKFDIINNRGIIMHGSKCK